MVVEFTRCGLYCPAGDFFVDPWAPVERALVTHGHADHARPGHRRYLVTDAAAPVIRHRLGAITLDTVRYGEKRRIGEASVSFHPAGHVPGSAQIRIEVAGEVWVVSGDYKTEADGLSEAFEPVRCHTFVSECTFGLPVFDWPCAAGVAADINEWWAANAADGRFSLLGAYALGKAQRILALLDPGIGPVLTHGAVEATNAVMRAQGIALPPTRQVTPESRRATTKARWCWHRPRRSAAPGRAGSVRPPRASRAAGCACAARAAAGGRTGASSSPITPTGAG